MSLADMNIDFKTRGLSFTERLEQKVVALILTDEIRNDESSLVYKNAEEIKNDDWNEENRNYIKMALMGSPYKVIAEKVENADEVDYSTALLRLRDKHWDYLAVPGVTAEKVNLLSEYIKQKREVDKKTFKAVLPNVLADHQGIVNFTTDNIQIEGKTYKNNEFTSRIAGILAGMPDTRSATNYEVPEVKNVPVLEEPEKAIAGGELILINDGDKVRIARGVNSLTTFTEDHGKTFSKIRIIDIIDRIKDDIRAVWKTQYSGKVINNYDNKCHLIASIIAYFKQLERLNLLDSTYGNTCQINIIKQKEYLEDLPYATVEGKTIEEMTEQEIKEANTGDKVFLTGKIKATDTMEDADFEIFL